MIKIKYVAVAAGLIVVMAVCLSLGGHLVAQNSTTPKTSIIAVCYTQTVLQQYTRAKDLTKAQSVKQESLLQQEKRHKESLEALIATLKNYKPESPIYKEKVADINKRGIQMKVASEMNREQMIRDYIDQTNSMFDELSQAVSDVAKRKGIAVVICPEPAKLMAQDPQNIQAEILTRKILYSDGSIDITGDVLQVLNERYVAKHK